MDVHFLNQIKDGEQWKKAYGELVEKLDEMYQEEEYLYYRMYTEGIETKRIDELIKSKHEVMTNQKLKSSLTFWKEQFCNDPLWRRRLEVFLGKMELESLDSHPELVKLQQQLQTNLLESTFDVDGIEYNLGKVHSTIMENPDRELRNRLFKESKRIGEENEEFFRRLIKKRNELAQEKGYHNYYQFRCSLKEIDIDSYMSEMNNLLADSRDVSNNWSEKVKAKFEWDTIHQYDQYYSTFNYHQIPSTIFSNSRLTDVLKEVLQSLDISIKEIPVSIESFDIPYGGFCININPNQIKLVVNKSTSYSGLISAVHELGHAVDGYYGSFKYPELYRFFSSIAAEGIAELFQTIASDKEFLVTNYSFDEDIINTINEIPSLLDSSMVKINHYYSVVEYELYKNPEKNFQEIANHSYQQVFGYKGETFHPASEMFYVENPAFFQDYNYALAIRDMIRYKFDIKSMYGEKDVFKELLEKFIIPNQLFTWQERVESLCGEPLTFKYVAKNISEDNW